MSDSATRSAAPRRDGAVVSNPLTFHLEKLRLEVTCSLCLGFFKRPALLPCSHIFCSECVPDPVNFGAECPLCGWQVPREGGQRAPFMESIVAIYKNLNAAYCTSVSQAMSSDARIEMARPVSLDVNVTGKVTKESLNSFQEGKSDAQTIYPPRGNKRVWLPCSQKDSATDGTGKNEKANTCGIPIDGNREVSDLGSGIQFSGGLNRKSPLPSSRIISVSMDECMTTRDTNPVVQSVLDSPPSFGEPRNSDNSSDQRCEQISNSSLLRGSITKGDDRAAQMRPDSSASDTDSHLREAKRQKKLDFEPVAGTDSVLKLGTASNESFTNNTVCAFCHSSKISEVTGPMLHYSKGKLVEGDAAVGSDVISVHSICIDWAPQVYFKDDIVKNLKAEITRGAKLKCTKCGIKGAALGCYVKSCRKSYHVTCALEVPKCRWDHENFLLLCHAHSSDKFPNEKLNRNKNKPAHSKSQLTDGAEASDRVSNWVLCPSGLSSEEKSLLINFAEMKGALVSKSWTPDITHVIAGLDEDGAYVRTFKILMAILAGKWIVTIDWVKACMERKSHVDEEPYEVTIDNYGCRSGAKAGRLRSLNHDVKLLSCLNFYFSGDFIAERLEDYKELVIAAGGTVFSNKEELLEASRCGTGVSRTLIVYNLDPPQGCKLGEEVSILWQRSNEAQDIALKIEGEHVFHTWLLESIARHELQPTVVC